MVAQPEQNAKRTNRIANHRWPPEPEHAVGFFTGAPFTRMWPRVAYHGVSSSGKRKGSRSGGQSVSFHANRIADRKFAIAVCRGCRNTSPTSDDTCEARADVSSSATWGGYPHGRSGSGCARV